MIREEKKQEVTESEEPAGDVIHQLGEKIRQQAKRLSSLEQYKSLCERLIQQLSPDFPLPVREEHLASHPLPVETVQGDKGPDLAEIRAVLQDVQDACKKLESEKIALFARLQAQEESRKSLQANLITANSQIAALTEELAEAKAGLGSSRRQEGQIQQLQADSDSAELAAVQSQTAVELSQTRIQELLQENEEWAEENKVLTLKVNSLQETIDRANAESARINEDIETIRIDLERGAEQRLYLQEALSSAQEQTVHAEGEVQEMRGQLREADRVISGLRADLESRSQLLRSQVEERKQAAEVAKAQARELELKSLRLSSDLATQATDWKQEREETIKHYEEVLSALQAESKAAKVASSCSLEASESEVRRLSERLTTLQDSLRAQHYSTEQVETALKDAHIRSQRIVEERNSLKQDIQELTSDLQTVKLLCVKQQTALRELQEEHAKLALQKELSEQEIMRLQVLYKDISDENETLKGDLETLHLGLDEVTDTVQRTEKETADTKATLTATQAKEQAAREELTALRTLLRTRACEFQLSASASLLDQLAALLAGVEGVEREAAAVRRELEGVTGRLGQTETALERAKQVVERTLEMEAMSREQSEVFSKELSLLRQELNETRYQSSERLNKTHSDLQEAKREALQLSDRLQDQKRQNRSLESENTQLRNSVNRLAAESRNWEEKCGQLGKERKSGEILLETVISAIPSVRIKSQVQDFIHGKSAIASLEHSLSESKTHLRSLQSQLTTSSDPLPLHKEIQRLSDHIARQESALRDTRRQTEDLEADIQDTSRWELQRSEESDSQERTILELQNLLDRKTADLNQAQITLLGGQRERRSEGPRESVGEARREKVGERLEQAKIAILQLKKLSKTSI